MVRVIIITTGGRLSCAMCTCVDIWHAHAFRSEGPNSILNMSAILICCPAGPCCPSSKRGRKPLQGRAGIWNSDDMRNICVQLVIYAPSPHRKACLHNGYPLRVARKVSQKKVTIPFPITLVLLVDQGPIMTPRMVQAAGTVLLLLK